MYWLVPILRGKYSVKNQNHSVFAFDHWLCMIIVLKMKYLIALAQAANLGQSCSQLVLDLAPAAAWRDLQTGILQSAQRGNGKGAMHFEEMHLEKKLIFSRVYFKQRII